MPLYMRTSPVLVTGYDKMTDDQTGEVKTRRDGTLIESVLYQVEGDSRPRRTVMDPAINGSRPKVGDTVALDLESRQEPVARTGRDGRPYVAWADKFRVLGFVQPEPAK